VPKKAVVTFLLLALAGAALFVYFTFPRTKAEIPTSNNQVPFPSAPGPNDVPVPTTPQPPPIPVPDTQPHPTTPIAPHGPTLRVMAWASPAETVELQALADEATAETGVPISLTVEAGRDDYRRDLREAIDSAAPPDLCLIEARDFSGLDPAQDLVTVEAAGMAPRARLAFTVGGALKAFPDEFSVDVLYYNKQQFDHAGIGYPDRHWNWDILEAMSRALASLKLTDRAGLPVYPLELPTDFDFWNVLCSQAGHAALDANVWHLNDVESREAQVRALGFIHDVFHELTVTAPLPRAGEQPGRFFAENRATLLIAPSNLQVTWKGVPAEFTLLPGDMARASLAQVNGWAVTAKSSQPDAAARVAEILCHRPVHAGWSAAREPASLPGLTAICYEALDQAILPRIEPRNAPMARFIDAEINGLARNAQAQPGPLYDRILAEYQNFVAPPIEGGLPEAAHGLTPKIHGTGQLRGM